MPIAVGNYLFQVCSHRVSISMPLNHVAVKQSCNIHRNVDEYVRTALRRHVLTSVLGTCDNHRAPTSLACLHEFIDESKPSSAFGPSDVGRSVGQADPLFALLQHTCQ